jgi:hypothetical protein
MLAQSFDGPGVGAACAVAANPTAAQATIEMMLRFMMSDSFVDYVLQKRECIK